MRWKMSLSRVLAFGFIQLYLFLRQRGETTYSLADPYCIALGATVAIVDVTIHGFMGPVLATDYLSATGAAQATAGALLRFYILLDLTLIIPWILPVYGAFLLYSASVWRGKIFSRPLATIGMILGVALFAGYAAGFFGTYFVLSPSFFLFSAVALLWVVALGIFLFRAKT